MRIWRFLTSLLSSVEGELSQVKSEEITESSRTANRMPFGKKMESCKLEKIKERYVLFG